MKIKVSDVISWIVFIIIMVGVTYIFFRYIDPLINKREVIIQLEDVTMVVYKNNEEGDTTETEIIHIDDGPVYMEVEIN